MSVNTSVRKIILVGLAVIFAFLGGFSFKDLASGVRHPDALSTILALMPQHLRLGLRAVAGQEEQVPAPLQSYADALATVQANYYGKTGTTQDLTYSAIRGMMASLGDRYTRFLAPADYAKMQEDNQGEFVGIGAQLDQNPKGEIVVVKPLPNSPAIKAHVLSGDIIAKVGAKPVLGMDITKVVSLIRGEPGTPVTLTLIRKDAPKPVVVTIVRNYVRQEVVVSKMIDPVHKVGYIALAQFNEESDPQINKAMDALQAQGMKALVFDLRGNPGGLLNAAQDIASRFVSNGPIVWVKERAGEMQSLNVEPRQHNHPRYPLAVLVNDGSASASEITSGAIKDTNAGLLIGGTTFGKGLVQTIIPLTDRSAVAITTAHYYTPLKKDINHKGIVPDIEVKLTDQDERAMNDYVNKNPNDPIDVKYDRQLQKALTVLNAHLAAGEKPRGWL